MSSLRYCACVGFERCGNVSVIAAGIKGFYNCDEYTLTTVFQYYTALILLKT